MKAPFEVAESLQEGLDRLNTEDPPTYRPPPFLANYRHPCLKTTQAKMTGRGVSTAIDLKEVYATSWDGIVPVLDQSSEWAIIFRQGSCKYCRQVARSATGRIVEVATRPPVQGRVSRD